MQGSPLTGLIFPPQDYFLNTATQVGMLKSQGLAIVNSIQKDGLEVRAFPTEQRAASRNETGCLMEVQGAE